MYERGSIWRKWDLHIHTPASLWNHYGGDNEEIWEKFICDLERLPPEFKVIGINDYIFLDGYKKVLKAKQSGRLLNIDLILPVIELRLDKFGGSKTKLSRVNFHVIFSDHISPEIIETQFIAALHSKYQISPQYSECIGEWKALITKDSLRELGKLIIDSVPPERRDEFGDPLIEGFNNINFSLQDIEEALDSHYFKENYITTVGKTEWADIKWDGHTIAEKKHIINTAQLVFISSQSVKDYHNAKKSLTDGRVNDRLLDCSDAHYFSDSQEKDRIGNCFTWIKADPTFEGLKQVLVEFDQRVYIGEIPEKVKIVENNKTKYIESVEIKKKAKSTLEEIWFDNHIKFNHDLVAIIGNKGSGKSALVDIVGLLGNSHHDKYSFLNRDKFCNPKDNKAKHFKAILKWESGQVSKKDTLDSLPEGHEVERVKYIPQQFFDTICNEIGTNTDTAFDKELKKVIFSHVPESQKLGFNTLDELLKYRTDEHYKRIEIIKGEIGEYCLSLAELESQRSDENIKKINEELKTKEEEIEVLEKNPPQEEVSPQNDPEKQKKMIEIGEKIKSLQEERDKLTNDKNSTEEELGKTNRLIAQVDKILLKVDNLEKQIDSFKKENQNVIENLGIEFEKVIKVQIDKKIIETKRNEFNGRKDYLEKELDPANKQGLVFRLNQIEQEIEELQNQLDEPNKKYQKYIKDLETWNKQKENLLGDIDKPGTIRYLKKRLEDIEKTIPQQVSDIRKNLYKKAREIFDEIKKICKVYEELYKPVQEFADSNVVNTDFQPSFRVSIEENNFGTNFLSYINQGVRGSFYGTEEGSKRVRDIIEHYNFNEVAETESFLNEIIHSLNWNMREEKKEKIDITSQLRKGITLAALYKYIFSLDYLKPKFTLKLGNRYLEQLSPGEKGAVLLIFYLLVDKDDIPLIIDQPEENLDNQFIFQLLVPCLKEAKKRRQIFIVTHNPNLAVVCDAEQIIHCSIDKADKYQVSYISGSIENPKINRCILDVLEGTKPAFQNRESKYLELKRS